MRLILLRHGESEWNRDNRFTGWADVDLTELGIAQMREAGNAMRTGGIDCDIVFTSVLTRCIHATWVTLEAMERMWLPQVLDWRLNERHYGALTGRLKADAVRLYGADAVHRWRRSYEAEPPAIDAAAAAHVPIDGRYSGLAAADIPGGESLRQTVARVRGCWRQRLVPTLRANRSVLVVAHGNSLRGLIKIIEEVSDADIARVEVGNGAPIVYELDDALKPIRKQALPLRPRQTSEIL